MQEEVGKSNETALNIGQTGHEVVRPLLTKSREVGFSCMTEQIDRKSEPVELTEVVHIPVHDTGLIDILHTVLRHSVRLCFMNGIGRHTLSKDFTFTVKRGLFPSLRGRQRLVSNDSTVVIDSVIDPTPCLSEVERVEVRRIEGRQVIMLDYPREQETDSETFTVR